MYNINIITNYGEWKISISMIKKINLLSNIYESSKSYDCINVQDDHDLFRYVYSYLMDNTLDLSMLRHERLEEYVLLIKYADFLMYDDMIRFLAKHMDNLDEEELRRVQEIW